MIIESQLQPGEQLREMELCDRLGVSRTPLREAFKVLEVEGLVDLKPNRGAFVSRLSIDEISELFEVISNLERVAVELAIERIDDRQLGKLVRMHERMMKQYRAGSRRECFQTDFDTHNAIVALTGNSLLIAMHGTLMLRARRTRYLALSSQARWDQSMQEHGEIIAAFRDRDASLASCLMRGHVQQTGKVICQRLEAEAGKIQATLNRRRSRTLPEDRHVGDS